MKLDYYRKLFDDEIRAVLKSDDENTVLLCDYMLGGKRLRPIALNHVYRSYTGKDIIKEALCVEFLHASSLIFDDIMDEDDMRHRKPGVQKILKDNFNHNDQEYNGNIFSYPSKRYAASRSMLIGLLADSYSRKVLINSGLPNVLKAIGLLNEAIQALIKGQAMDIEFETKEITESDYIEMIRCKTAYLFATSLKIGAVLAGASEQDSLFEFGIKTGIAFQLQDDLLDLTDKKGNTRGSDIMKGKKTLLAIKTFERFPEFSDYLGTNQVDPAISLIKKSGADEYCRHIAEKNIEEAKALSDNEFLLQLADYMLKREV